ncbi:E3 ubiquitin-protein ligase RFI2-like isoform X3 [Amaranthus tricolor]|uniref:E3 ubiquitin-protein ligase RFI2-like isoform X3 n=1 Tax=Amaranthus tricolor TaxID=29722 RepID=UPI002582FBD6|nr:E3 ubiquitin-protein ligase RFI2-like isoform X3 [Amaranthus tricolor]
MVRSDYSDQGIDLNVEPESSIPCSICFDLVTYDGDRSRAKLKCGHEFHLEVAGVVAKQNGWIIVINDCIGSAFNAKGAMQCPNCRSVEKGQWKYSSGSLTSPELGVDDGSVDHYPFYFTLAETPYRVHICPFRGFTQFYPSSHPFSILSGHSDSMPLILITSVIYLGSVMLLVFHGSTAV